MNITPRKGQTYADIAIQMTGDLSSVYDIAVKSGKSVTDTPVASSVDSVYVINETAVKVLESRGIVPASNQ